MVTVYILSLCESACCMHTISGGTWNTARGRGEGPLWIVAWAVDLDFVVGGEKKKRPNLLQTGCDVLQSMSKFPLLCIRAQIDMIHQTRICCIMLMWAFHTVHGANQVAKHPWKQNMGCACKHRSDVCSFIRNTRKWLIPQMIDVFSVVLFVVCIIL